MLGVAPLPPITCVMGPSLSPEGARVWGRHFYNPLPFRGEGGAPRSGARERGRRLLTSLVIAVFPFAPAIAGDITASAATHISATIYRAPNRAQGGFNLNALGGFALVTETRTVHLPAGESRLRFEGVVGGIVPESVIVTGLPRGVIEKNRDAALLSPASLMERAIGAQVFVTRTNRKTGKMTREAATIRAANADGVMFQTAQGVEAFKCSGTSEAFSYARVPQGLSSKPTLSVLTRSPTAVTAAVTLSYIAEGFDWAADYTATINPDGKTLNLGGWITLANGNGESLASAQTQIVAGRLNHRRAPPDRTLLQPQVAARCWPMGNTGHAFATSDPVPPVRIELVRPYQVAYAAALGFSVPVPAPPPPPMAMRSMAADNIIVTGAKKAEQLGDLKLYRIPATTIAARQSKQSRLIDAAAVPFAQVYVVDIEANGGDDTEKAQIILRTKNTKANNLGLPLPSGRMAVFEPGASGAQFVGELSTRDLADAEEIEWKYGAAFNVSAKHVTTAYTAAAPEIATLAPGLRGVWRKGATLGTVTFTNANAAPIAAELRLRLDDDDHLKAADAPMGTKDGRPIFRLNIPAHDNVTVHYIVG